MTLLRNWIRSGCASNPTGMKAGQKEVLTEAPEKGKVIKEDLFRYAEKQAKETGNLQTHEGESGSRAPRRYYREIQRFPAPKFKPKTPAQLDDYVASVFAPIRKSRSEEFYIALTDKDNKLVKALFSARGTIKSVGPDITEIVGSALSPLLKKAPSLL